MGDMTLLMENELTFEIWEGEGRFVYPSDQFDDLIDELHEVLDTYERQAVNEKTYIAELQKLIAKAPQFIDVYAHLSYAFYRQNKPKRALEAALAGMAIGEEQLPEGFDGNIVWQDWSNRPFLRACHGAVIAYMKLRRHKEAAKLIERMLAFNPNDNQGVRFLYGSETLRSGNEKRAVEIFRELAAHYPPYYYELALVYIQNEEWIAAATALRLGFYGNSYIAETLTGNPHPRLLNQWHRTSDMRTELAADYIEHYGVRWFSNMAALSFVRWLFNHSKVMGERAQISACREALQWERDIEHRIVILERERELRQAIDDQISSELVLKHVDRHGTEHYPWQTT